MLVGGTNKKHMVTYQVDPREDALLVSGVVTLHHAFDHQLIPGPHARAGTSGLPLGLT